MSASFANGNRLTLPPVVKGNHFFYKTASIKLDPGEVEKIVRAVKMHVEANALNPAQIEVLRAGDLDGFVKGAGDAVRRGVEKLSNGDIETMRSDAGVLVCEWANPHLDNYFSGWAFFSQVLSTGPEPYIMQTFHTHVSKKEGQQQEIKTSTRVLSEGEAFIFDPMTAHMVAPRRMGAGQLLIMLQVILKDKTPQDRAALVDLHPPLESDNDEQEVFNGY